MGSDSIECPLLAERSHNKKNKAKMGIVTVNDPKQSLRRKKYVRKMSTKVVLAQALAQPLGVYRKQ